MLIKIIFLTAVLSLLSCSSLTVEKRRVNGCDVVEKPYGNKGSLYVSCPELKMTLTFDNIPDGTDPLILKIEGVDAKREKGERINPYRVEVGEEILEGQAFREEWKLGDYRLVGFEYFVNGGSACYEEEEGYRIELLVGSKKVTLAKFYQEDTDCGGN